MARLLAEFESEGGTFDKQQEQLQAGQLKLVRNQMTTMLGQFLEMRQDMDSLRSSIVCRDDNRAKLPMAARETLEYRLEQLEKSLKVVVAIADQDEALRQRVSSLEQNMRDSFGALSKDLETTIKETWHQSFEGSNCNLTEKQTALAGRLENQLAQLEQNFVEGGLSSIQKQTAMEKQLAKLEEISDERESSVRALLERCAGLDNRTHSFEGSLAGLVDKQAEDLAAVHLKLTGLQDAFAEFDSSQKLAHLEQMIGEVATCPPHENLEPSLERCMEKLDEHVNKLASLDEQVSQLREIDERREEVFDATMQKHKEFASMVDIRFDSMQSSVGNCRDKLAEFIEVETQSRDWSQKIERFLADMYDPCCDYLNTPLKAHFKSLEDRLEDSIKQMSNRLESLQESVSERVKRQVSLEQSMHRLDLLLTDAAAKTDLDEVQERMKQLHDVVNEANASRDQRVKNMHGELMRICLGEKSSRDNMDEQVAQRLECIELIATKQPEFIDFTTEIEKRFMKLQDDHQRARDSLGASLLEQLRKEHSNHQFLIKEQWEREQKAREVHCEHYKELLRREREAREAGLAAHDRKLDGMESNVCRIDTIERAVLQERHRIWNAIRSGDEGSPASPVRSRSWEGRSPERQCSASSNARGSSPPVQDNGPMLPGGAQRAAGNANSPRRGGGSLRVQPHMSIPVLTTAQLNRATQSAPSDGSASMRSTLSPSARSGAMSSRSIGSPRPFPFTSSQQSGVANKEPSLGCPGRSLSPTYTPITRGSSISTSTSAQNKAASGRSTPFSSGGTTPTQPLSSPSGLILAATDPSQLTQKAPN